MRDLFDAPVLALSLWQPWASLIFAQMPVYGGRVKKHETRHWAFPRAYVGERLLIHASKRRCRLEASEISELAELVFPMGADYPTELPYGAFVGSVTVGGCYPTAARAPASNEDLIAGNWEPGRFACELLDAREFRRPIPALGRQGFWKVPHELVAEALDA